MPRLCTGCSRKCYQRGPSFLQLPLVDQAFQVVLLQPGHLAGESNPAAPVQQYVIRQHATAQKINTVNGTVDVRMRLQLQSQGLVEKARSRLPPENRTWSMFSWE